MVRTVVRLCDIVVALELNIAFRVLSSQIDASSCLVRWGSLLYFVVLLSALALVIQLVLMTYTIKCGFAPQNMVTVRHAEDTQEEEVLKHITDQYKSGLQSINTAAAELKKSLGCITNVFNGTLWLFLVIVVAAAILLGRG